MAKKKADKGSGLSTAGRKEYMAAFAKAIYEAQRATSQDEADEPFGRAFRAFLELHQEPVAEDLLVLVSELAVEVASYVGKTTYLHYELERGIEEGLFTRDSKGYIRNV